MKVYGVDFTSRPGRTKPITRVETSLEGNHLTVIELQRLPNFEAFDEVLSESGPWISGIDFPFGQSRRFIENIGWPTTWHGYVSTASALGREGFRKALDDYRRHRASGDREHRRATDVACGSISPQKLYGTPVALMFFEGARRLLDAGVTIPGLLEGDRNRIAVEAYPGVLARRILGRRSYKNDDKTKQSADQHANRRALLKAITNGGLVDTYGVTVAAPLELADDPQADTLDALLCAVQAAWAWMHRERAFGMPTSVDLLEGWIADPASDVKRDPLHPTPLRLITEQAAIEVARCHVLPPHVCRVEDGWPASAYRLSEEDLVWCVYLPSSGETIGGDRVVVVSKRTGRVLLSGLIGE
jgi:hypothetical protein